MKIGIDIGAQTIKIGTWKDNDYLIKTGFKTGSDFLETAGRIKKEVEELFGRPELAAVGCCGLLDREKKKILRSPNLTNWAGADFKQWEKIFGCPIILENDANLAIYGEATRGAGKGRSIVAGFTLGSGVGYGCVIKDKIYHGTWDVEAGHMILDPKGPECGCGQRGCLESYVSAGAIKRQFSREPDKLKDENAWDFISQKIAWGIQIITVVVKPDIFVLTGGIAQRKELLEKVQTHYRQLIKTYPKEIKKTELVLGKFLPNSGIIGAIEMAKKSPTA